jgi:tRNA/rRNA methyltransferase/tRNA (cytidine32/uridine32-2'-O)-methyltransferase
VSARLSRVAVVLVEPRDPVNIGATVRAMKNMGVSELRLVRPVAYEPERLEGIAHNTRDVIDRIRCFESFDEAVADCVRLAAFTARRRAAKWHVLPPRQAAHELLATIDDRAGTVGMVFGREDSGLPNDILDRAHTVVVIPTTDHASMNLAQAVLIGLYELHLAAGDATRRIPPPRKDAPAATEAQLEQYFTDVERSLRAIEFFKTRQVEHIMRTVRSLTVRASPDARELSLVRAMAIEVMRYMERRRT